MAEALILVAAVAGIIGTIIAILKIIVDIKDLILPPQPVSEIAVPPQAPYIEFKSRKQMEEGIMSTLDRGDVKITGIHGMGGIGKSTMAERIRNKALENNVFNKAVMVDVGKDVDELKIQLEIGRSLGLMDLEKESSESRRQKLNEILKDTNRILLILDNVWKYLELEKLGIPRRHKTCTILITSRNKDVLKAMNVKDADVFGMEELSEVDAWKLFRWRAGPCVDDNKVNSIANDVVNKCSGLPLALKVVGDVLKDERDERVWEDVLRELEGVHQEEIPDYLENVYNPLKLSYDFLRSTQHKLVFLLCSLYPEDVDIPIEQLTYFSMGIGILKGGIWEARNRMISVTNRLKNRSLLSDSNRGDDYVRMHDVVRDFCKFTAKKERDDCPWISVSQRSELTNVFAFPNLRLLFLICNWRIEEFELDNFLGRVKDLYVLSIQKLSLMSLPCTTQSHENLKTLLLDRCWRLETLSPVGKFVNLEILICRHCDSIKELPQEMKELKRLKLLDLSWCRNLQRIGEGIISSLVVLEELKMLRSFKKWEEGENARLREVEELKMLRCLEIEIQDHPVALAAVENMQLQTKLDIFHIILSCSQYSSDFDIFRSNKKLKVRFNKENVNLGHWIEMQLLPHTEALYLREGNLITLATCEKLVYLELYGCENIRKIFMTPMDGIEHLKLSNLPKLEKIWDDDLVSSYSFQNLKKLQLNDLSLLIYFGNDCLPQLEDLRINDCEMMEQVFLWKGGLQNSHHITKVFPKLKWVKLYNLPKLTSFYRGIEGIEFPQLRELEIKGCATMKSLVSKEMESNENNSGGGRSITSSNANIDHLFCRPQGVSLGCLEKLVTDWNPFRNYEIDISSLNELKEIEIEGDVGSTSFIRSSIAKNLCNLTKLTIEDCGEMSHVIADDEKEGMSGGETTLLQFPKLEELMLRRLPKLVNFCERKCDVELPLLREVQICYCPNMKNLTLGSLSAPNLGSFHTDMNNDLHLQVPFNSTKKLTLYGFDNPLSCDKIDVFRFNELGELTIYQYKGSVSFFPSSIARFLVNLTTLTIEYCYEMVKVIEDDEEEKENVGSSVERRSLFPRLQRLNLEHLPKLVNFCEWKCDIELPSLMRVVIIMCKNMKRFTSGHLATPNLASVREGFKVFDNVGDLNGLLQQLYQEGEEIRGGEEDWDVREQQFFGCYTFKYDAHSSIGGGGENQEIIEE